MENPKTFSVGRLTEVEKHQKRKRGMGQRGPTAHWTQLAERRRLVCRKVGLSIAVLHSATSVLTPPRLTSGRARRLAVRDQQCFARDDPLLGEEHEADEKQGGGQWPGRWHSPIGAPPHRSFRRVSWRCWFRWRSRYAWTEVVGGRRAALRGVREGPGHPT